MVTIVIAEDEPNVVELVRVTLEDDRVRVIAARPCQQRIRGLFVEREQLRHASFRGVELTRRNVVIRPRDLQQQHCRGISGAVRLHEVVSGNAAGGEKILQAFEHSASFDSSTTDAADHNASIRASCKRGNSDNARR